MDEFGLASVVLAVLMGELGELLADVRCVDRQLGVLVELFAQGRDCDAYRSLVVAEVDDGIDEFSSLSASSARSPIELSLSAI